MKSDDKKGVLQIIDRVISLGYKSDKVKSLGGSRKIISKPKVRYFKIKIG